MKIIFKVHCQPAKNGRPGYLVVTSDFAENLRSTFSQLHQCFSQCYGDILDIDDGKHALMPKLKNIYRTVGSFSLAENVTLFKADKSYQDYLSGNPLKILENLKTVSEGREVTLESFLESQKPVVTQTYVRAAPQRMVATPSPAKRLIPREHFIKREGGFGSPEREQVVRVPPPPEKDPTRVELNLLDDQQTQTSKMNINGRSF